MRGRVTDSSSYFFFVRQREAADKSPVEKPLRSPSRRSIPRSRKVATSSLSGWTLVISPSEPSPALNSNQPGPQLPSSARSTVQPPATAARARLDPGLDWLFEALSPLPPSDSSLVPAQFEHELPPEALNEQLPRVTSIDFLVQTSKLVICTEAKRGEDGMGRCSCPPGAPKVADCSQKVLDRPLYWRAAYDLFAMPDRQPGRPCPVSLGYQAIRSVAAARYLATGRRAPVFALVYDGENPYFTATGAWPGWPSILEHTLRGQDDEIRFRAVSWQELLPLLPVDDELREWARVKHRLE